MAEDQLPGEDGPLPMRYGGAPITQDEALGVARRLARLQAEQGRRAGRLSELDTWPDPRELTQVAWRAPVADVLLARARAEMEGSTLSDVIRAAIHAYATASPGSQVQYPAPRPKR